MVAVSALYEVLLIVVLFLLPLMAALNYRFWRQQAWAGRWQELHVLSFEQRGMVQVLVAGLLAFVVSVTGLALPRRSPRPSFRPQQPPLHPAPLRAGPRRSCRSRSASRGSP